MSVCARVCASRGQGAACADAPVCDVFVPPGPGSCEEAKLRVLQFIKETEEMVLASNNSWFPLGESFLVAKGIRLTNEELALPPLSPPREMFSEKFRSGSDYAIHLAAQSSECRARPMSPPISPGSRSWNSCSSVIVRALLPWFPQAGGFLGKKRPRFCRASPFWGMHGSPSCPQPSGRAKEQVSIAEAPAAPMKSATLINM